MSEFKKGDRVEYVGGEPYETPSLVGHKGTITGESPAARHIIVDWDEESPLEPRNVLVANLRLLDPEPQAPREPVAGDTIDPSDYGKGCDASVPSPDGTMLACTEHSATQHIASGVEDEVYAVMPLTPEPDPEPQSIRIEHRLVGAEVGDQVWPTDDEDLDYAWPGTITGVSTHGAFVAVDHGNSVVGHWRVEHLTTEPPKPALRPPEVE